MIGETAPVIGTIGHQEMSIDLSHDCQTAAQMPLYTGDIGANSEDFELLCTRAVGHTACDFLLNASNRCVEGSSDDDSVKNGTAGPSYTDICKSACYSCLVGATCVGTPLGDVSIDQVIGVSKITEQSSEDAKNILQTQGSSSHDEALIKEIHITELRGEHEGKELSHIAVVADSGTKGTILYCTVECGRCAYAAFLITIPVETENSNLDGAPPLNGLGDLEQVGFETESSCQASDVGHLPPGTRPGNQSSGCVSGPGIHKSKPGYCGTNQLAKDSIIGKAEAIVYNYGPVADVLTGKQADVLPENGKHGKAPALYTDSNDDAAEGSQRADTFVPLAQHYLEVVVGLYDVVHSPDCPRESTKNNLKEGKRHVEVY